MSDHQAPVVRAAASCKTAVPVSPDSIDPVPASRFSEEHRPLPGCNLSSPRAFAPLGGQVPGPLPVPTDATSAFRLSDALRSRSITRRHFGFLHTNKRWDSDRLGFRQPQPEHVLELGKNTSATTSVDPYHRHLYVSWRRSSAMEASWIPRLRPALALRPFLRCCPGRSGSGLGAGRRSRLATARRSTTTVEWLRARDVVSLCMASRRTWATLAWVRASAARLWA